MGVNFSYLQDDRTTSEYQAYVEAGIKNQRIAIEQILKQWEKKGYKITAIWLDKNEKFQSTIKGVKGYNPDVRLDIVTPNGTHFLRPYEVKVTDKENSGEYIDIKSWQIDYLVNHHKGSYILHSSPERYFTLSCEWIKKNCRKVVNGKIGNKECYRIHTPSISNLKWVSYENPLNLVPYPKRKGN